MSASGLSFVIETPTAWLLSTLDKLGLLLWSPGSDFSVLSLLAALCVALFWIGLRRRKSKRGVRLKVLMRAVFPRWLISSPSSRADIGFFFLNSSAGLILFGWMILSYHLVSKETNDALVWAFAARSPTDIPEVCCAIILTIALFLAYEIGYWVDHYLSHTVPFLWEFHKVHHTAEVLSPLTNYRMHPVDSVVFGNILALFMGVTEGVLNYLFGTVTHQFAISNSNVIAVVFTYLVAHLQHSHFWISFPGRLGYILLSPAHHQIHHSINPIHFNKNLGSFLAVWDWLFGTLYIPAKERERLVFGVEPKDSTAHTVTGALVAPIGNGLSLLVPWLRLRRLTPLA